MSAGQLWEPGRGRGRADLGSIPDVHSRALAWSFPGGLGSGAPALPQSDAVLGQGWYLWSERPWLGLISREKVIGCGG